MSLDAVISRRLKPVYDAIDADNPKKAIQEAEKIIKKHPSTICAKVLKALALIRSERLCEAFSIIDAVDVPGAVHDENTLQAFVHCFREAGVVARISTLYERVVQINPTEHNLTQLFMAYVRLKAFKNQQHTAQRLYKETQNVPYFFWTLMSQYMQAQENPELGAKMLLPLAKKMVSAHVDKRGYKASAELELHLMILEGMKDYCEAEKLLGSELADKILSIPLPHRTQRRLTLLHKGESHRLAVDRAMEELNINNDDWFMWQLLFDSAFSLMQMDGVEEEKRNSILNEVVGVVLRECERATRARGPHLARLELTKRLLVADRPLRPTLGTHPLGEPATHIARYLRQFYSKPCCYSDLAPYLILLNEEHIKIVADDLETFRKEQVEIIKKPEVDKETVESCVWGVIVVERLRRRLGLEQTGMRETRRDQARRLAPLLNLDLSDLTGGAIASLVANALWNEWQYNDDWQSFHEMIMLLEHTATRFKADANAKIILSRAYAHVGCLNRLIALYKALDIKAVLKDTLGHYLFPMYEVNGRPHLGIMHYTELSDMYSQAEREIHECLVVAYKNGGFSQIPGLCKLVDTMDNSAQAVGCDVMNRYLSGLFVIENIDEAVNTLYGDEEPIEWSNLLDNRDVCAVPSFEIDSDDAINDAKKRSYREYVDMTQLRHLLCRALAAIGRVSGSSSETGASTSSRTPTTATQVQDALSLFMVHMAYCQTEYPSTAPTRLLQSASPIQFGQWLHSGSFEMFTLLLKSAAEIAVHVEEKKTLTDALLPSSTELKQLFDAVMPVLPPVGSSYNLHDFIFTSSRALQCLSVCQLIVRLIKLRTGEIVFKGQKPKPKTAWSNALEALLVGIAADATRLTSVLKAAMDQLTRNDLNLFPVFGNDWDKETSEKLMHQKTAVESRLLKSYHMSLEDMCTTVSNRFARAV